MAEESVENSEEYLKEVEEGRVIHNLRLLELKFIDPTGEEIDQETRGDLFAIQNKGSVVLANGIEDVIFIYYNTESGVIEYPEGEYFGDYSRIHTSIIRREDSSGDGDKKSREILLYRPGDMLSVAQYSAALTGEEVKDLGHRRIMPQRISSEHINMVGVEEAWGETEIARSAKGDLIMLKTIRKFNEKYGPSR